MGLIFFFRIYKQLRVNSPLPGNTNVWKVARLCDLCTANNNYRKIRRIRSRFGKGGQEVMAMEGYVSSCQILCRFPLSSSTTKRKLEKYSGGEASILCVGAVLKIETRRNNTLLQTKKSMVNNDDRLTAYCTDLRNSTQEILHLQKSATRGSVAMTRFHF